MEKDEIYQSCGVEYLKRQFKLQSLGNKGANLGFTISNDNEKVCDSVHPNKMDNDIYQGISKIIHKCNISNDKKNLISLSHRIENHVLVSPPEIMKKELFPRHSIDKIHHDFSILCNPHKLQKNKIDLTQCQHNMNVIFQEVTNRYMQNDHQSNHNQ